MTPENPYASPRTAGEPTYAVHHDVTNRSLTWLLFSFQGRIPRRVFWGASIALVVAYFPSFQLIAIILRETPAPDSLWLISFSGLWVGWVWISIALQAKRWHDRDKSGWWILISFIPIVGPIIALVETGCLRGTIGLNRFGEDPTGDALAVTTLSRSELGQMMTGKVVELDGTDATDEHLAALLDNPEIEELRLGGTGITDDGIAHLRHLVTLRQLDLSLTRITDQGIESLLGLSNLTTLWLGGTKISDSGLLRLAALSSLKELHLANTDVSTEGVRQFQNLRPDCFVYS